MDAAPLLWINGFPGAGKLTVAKAITALDPSVKVIDNHMLIDPVAHRLGPGSREHPFYQQERKAERRRAFDGWVLEARFKDRMIIFTDCQSDNQLGRSVAEEYQMAAQQARRPFIPVYLSCDAQVNLQRASSAQRVQGQTTKLTDLAVLEDVISKNELFKFKGLRGVDLDTTLLLPADVARCILLRCEESLKSQDQD